MVGHGADAECTFAKVSCIGIQAGGFHFYTENTHLLPLVILLGRKIKSGIEIIRGKKIADVDVDAEGFGGVFCGGEEGEIGDRSKCTMDAEILNVTRSGAGTLGEDNIE